MLQRTKVIGLIYGAFVLFLLLVLIARNLSYTSLVLIGIASGVFLAIALISFAVWQAFFRERLLEEEYPLLGKLGVWLMALSSLLVALIAPLVAGITQNITGTPGSFDQFMLGCSLGFLPILVVGLGYIWLRKQGES